MIKGVFLFAFVFLLISVFSVSGVVIPPEPSCIDTDGGMNYEVVGNTTGNHSVLGFISHKDYCDSDTVLVDAYCRQDPYGDEILLEFDRHICLNGCFEGVCIKVTADENIGEVGSETFFQHSKNAWKGVNLRDSYDSPVVIMQPLSFNQSEPAHIRLVNVTSDSFEFKIEEWDYLDGVHGVEKASYLVLEEGYYDFGNDTFVEVGKVNVSDKFKHVTFKNIFNSRPIVLTQVQTYNEADSVVTRQRNISVSGFDVRLQEEENKGDGHAFEEVGYVAITRSEGVVGENRFEARAVKVNHEWSKINFRRSYFHEPLFFASIITYRGGDTAGLRYMNLTGRDAIIKIEEEQSRDEETIHLNEGVGYIIFEKEGLIVI